MQQQFQWTDELVKEFGRFYNNYPAMITGIDPMQKGIDAFKQSKACKSKKDWEIVSYGVGSQNPPILKVRRLSDGEVFTVGDSICLSGYSAFKVERLIEKIEIEIEGNKIMLHYSEGKYPLEYAKKNLPYKQKQPLFVTHDGVPIFEGDNVAILSCQSWIVNYPLKAVKKPFTRVTGNEFKYFSTEAAAKEYVLMNMPLGLSINDLYKIKLENGFLGDSLIEFLIEINKSKQQQ